MTPKTKLVLAATATVLLLAVGTAVVIGLDSRAWRGKQDKTAAAAVATVTAEPLDTTRLLAGMQEVLAGYRKIIVLFADEKTLGVNERAMANQVGHENP